MGAIRIIGIIALVIFLIAIIGKYTIKWFVTKWEKRDKAVSLLGHVAIIAALVATAASGIVYLFA